LTSTIENQPAKKTTARRLARWIAIGLAAATGIVLFGAIVNLLDLQRLGWDGDTFSISLTNDTAESLAFTQCADDECDSFAKRHSVGPGESISVVGTVDQPSWYVVTNQGGLISGCFEISFDERPSMPELLASQADTCP
jgi:hypothetical protein